MGLISEVIVVVIVQLNAKNVEQDCTRYSYFYISVTV